MTLLKKSWLMGRSWTSLPTGSKNRPEKEPKVWKFKSIKSHQGPIDENHPNWMGSKYNLLIHWETGEKTYQPLTEFAKDAPAECALYARDNKLLDTQGWKRFRSLAKKSKKMFRMINQAKLRSYRTNTQVYVWLRSP